jgi:hypothetical protein
VRGNHKPLICLGAPILTFPRRGKEQGFYDTLPRGKAGMGVFKRPRASAEIAPTQPPPVLGEEIKGRKTVYVMI